MLGTDAGAGFERKLFDYTYLLDHILQSTESLGENPAGQPKDGNVDHWRFAAQKSGSCDDLTDWVLTYQLTDERAREYRFNRWQETKSLLWLLSTLVAVGRDDPHLAELTRAAATSASTPIPAWMESAVGTKMCLPFPCRTGENHLLRLIDRHVSFQFVRDELRDSYSETGRPSIDPEGRTQEILFSDQPFHPTTVAPESGT